MTDDIREWLLGRATELEEIVAKHATSDQSGHVVEVLNNASQLRRAAAEIERLRTALSELVDAVIAEVNEKGGGGNTLARLSDARRTLKPKAERKVT